jgi:endonuclease/exonuclease/phosphatase family metal-dependent hydrolase
MQENVSSTWANFLLPAITVTFGMQIIRALPPYLQYLLGDRFGWNSIQMGGAALVIFATAFLAGWLNRQWGLQTLLVVTAGGVGLTRLAIQLWNGEPLIDMILVFAGTSLFLLFLAAYLALTSRQPDSAQAAYQFGLAVLLGLALDSALHGAFLTYDAIWQAGAIPFFLTVALATVQFLALARQLSSTPAHSASLETGFFNFLPWLAIGPFLFLQLLMFQSQARLAVLTGWNLPAVFGWIMLAHLLGLTLVMWRPAGKTTVIIAGLLLMLTVWPRPESSPWLTAGSLLIGQVSAALIITAIFYGIGHGTPPKRLNSMALIHGLSMILMVGLIFAYYAAFDLHVPYRNDWLPVLAGIIIVASGLGVWRSLPAGASWQPVWAVGVSAWLLMLLPLAIWPACCGRSTFSPPAAGESVRVMNYNLHNGFNTLGQLDIEALAQIIETQKPDVVTLQEMSRGWAVNGSLDIYNWLLQRLDFPYAYFTPSSDELWGIAVFSRYPITHAEDFPLPPRDLPLKRSFTYLEIDTGQATPLSVINAHFHHLETDSSIRLIQTDTVLNFLQDKPLNRFIMTGDLNAGPAAKEILHLYQHGFKDAVIEANLQPGYTYPADAPNRRLDYLLYSPDLTATGVVIPPGAASDHLGIAADIRQK